MPYPFPGMNPWLENHRLWSDVHQRVITTLAESLAGDLEPRYFVGVGTHTYISTNPMQPLQSRYPDVSVIYTGGGAVITQPLADVATPYFVQIPVAEPYEEPFLEVQLLPDGEVVTVIELLSYTNKRAGDERQTYLKKRKEYLDSEVHFVEIDLLRSGEPMPYTNLRPSDYRIVVRRKEKPDYLQIYPFSLRQPIPIFPLPLLPGDQEPHIHLGDLLQTVYDRARYRLILDYTKPPEPRLNPADQDWAQTCLHN